MTPFGEKVRALRAKKGATLKEMAADLHISSAYLSALEHGRRGQPSVQLIRQICGYFGIFWDEAEELERLATVSHPRATVDTAGLSPRATEVANRMAERIHLLEDGQLDRIMEILAEVDGESRPGARSRRPGRRR